MFRRLLKKESSLTIEEQVVAAQNGDETIRNQLIQTYQPFIAKSVSEVCKRYINPNQDDEFSIGLIGFNDAINSYSIDKGSSFLSFAKLVVKRKVIDYIRQDQSKYVTASLDHVYEDEEQMENPHEVTASTDRFKEQSDTWNRKTEIEEFNKQLNSFKLSFEELTRVSPKHQDARESAIKVARTINDSEELRHYVFEKKKLPIKALEGHVEVSKKTLERNRKFILAILILMSEDYVYLKDYIKGVGL